MDNFDPFEYDTFNITTGYHGDILQIFRQCLPEKTTPGQKHGKNDNSGGYFTQVSTVSLGNKQRILMFAILKLKPNLLHHFTIHDIQPTKLQKYHNFRKFNGV